MSPRSPLLYSFYFPQFHPIPENDKFWGVNFTEWTNVRKYVQSASQYHDILLPAEELGMYDLRDVDVRTRQAKLAKEHGVAGFIYYHYWFSGKPVMDSVLNALLIDGQPNVAFMLCWANEHWTKRWDGGSNDVLLKQQYDLADIDAHYHFLVKFWRHPLHTRGPSGEIPFFIYRIDEENQQNLTLMISSWQDFLRRDGLGRLHVIQLLGHSTSAPLVSWADAYGEFWPAYGGLIALDSPIIRHQHTCHYPGVLRSWNNSPRHVNDGKATADVSNAFEFGKRLRLAMSKVARAPTCFPFVLISSWNEWGEGNVLEPDSMNGRATLREISASVQDFLPVREAPLVCIVARTTPEQWNHRFYNGASFLSSVRALEANWQLLLLPIHFHEDSSFESVLVEASRCDNRTSVLLSPSPLRTPFDPCLNGYHLTDWAIRRCSPRTEWVIITDTTNVYEARSLQALMHVASPIDMVILRTKSRYHRWNEFRTTSPDCRPLTSDDLIVDLRSGMADTGQVALRYRRVLAEEVFFSASYPSVCQTSGGRTIAQLAASGWRSELAPLSEGVYFMQNPNPESCHRLGGLWRDSSDFSRFECIDLRSTAVDLPVELPETPYRCLVDNSMKQWMPWPAFRVPNEEDAFAAQFISTQTLILSAHCGVEFDGGFYVAFTPEALIGDAPRHWSRVGFVRNSPYRFLRSSSYTPTVWLSETCFLVRAVLHDHVVRGQLARYGSCPGVANATIFGRHRKTLILACRLELDTKRYLAENQDVANAGVEAYDHFWRQGFKEGRAAWFIKNPQGGKHACATSGLSSFCDVLRSPISFGELSGKHLVMFVQQCSSGCVDSEPTDSLVAYTCAFSAGQYWIEEPEGKLCVFERREAAKEN